MADEDSSRPTVLVVHHTVSPATTVSFEAAIDGLQIEELSDIDVQTTAALSADVAATLRASAVLLMCPVNIGYLAGAMKHYFDQIYYPCLEQTKSLPYAAILHSNLDASGALRALAQITGALEWTAVAEPLVISAEPDKAMREQISELASTLGAHAAGLLS